MEQKYGTRNIVNSYVNDNLQRVKVGVQLGKTVGQVEKTWSRGMMEQLGYTYVEALDERSIKNENYCIKVHWFKSKQDSLL